MSFRLLRIAVVLALPIAVAAQSQQPRRVQFVGCPSDGQQGPQSAPQKPALLLAVPAKAANQLAYYQATDGLGTLAPRGWYCFGTYGSNGESLYLSPDPITTHDFFNSKPKWRGLTGYGIQISLSDGGTSGRFEVAKVIARVFPKHRAFVDSVLAEGIEPYKDFLSGPFPGDRLTYKSPELVEFITPANDEGLGTQSWLQPNSEPIRGMAQLDTQSDISLIQLSMRLPASSASLGPIILSYAESPAQR